MSQIAKSAPLAVFAAVGFGLFLLAGGGCNQSAGIDAKTVAAYRTSFTLAEEPDGVQTVADVRSTLLGETEDEHDHDHSHEGHDHAHHDDAHDDDHDDHAHDDHDHDGDGHQDHADADHDDEAHGDHDHDDHAHDDHDHEGHDHADHAHAENHAHAAEATEPQEVVMVGHIGGLANPWANTQPEFPFSKTKAIFYLADPQAIVANAESGHAHAPGEECAFCAANAEDQADMLAVVQFVDKNGNVLPVDVRQLFKVKENDMVVVRGKAHVTAGRILVINAEGLYVRQ